MYHQQRGKYVVTPPEDLLLVNDTTRPFPLRQCLASLWAKSSCSPSNLPMSLSVILCAIFAASGRVCQEDHLLFDRQSVVPTAAKREDAEPPFFLVLL